MAFKIWQEETRKGNLRPWILWTYDPRVSFQNSVLTISKSTQVSKVAGLDSLSGSFLKDGAKFLAKPISDLCNLSINSEKFLELQSI